MIPKPVGYTDSSCIYVVFFPKCFQILKKKSWNPSQWDLRALKVFLKQLLFQLVCDHRSEGCIFPRSNCCGAQALSTFTPLPCIWNGMPVQSVSVCVSISIRGVHKVCENCPSVSALVGSVCIPLFGPYLKSMYVSVVVTSACAYTLKCWTSIFSLKVCL